VWGGEAFDETSVWITHKMRDDPDLMQRVVAEVA